MNIRRFFPKRRQLSLQEQDKRNQRLFMVLSYTMTFSLLGFFGSCVLVVAWFFAPFTGYSLWRGMPSRVSTNPWLAALGVWLGGLPLWLAFTHPLTHSWTVSLIWASITPLLFLLGAGINLLRQRRRIRPSASGGNSPTPPTSGQSSRLPRRIWWARRSAGLPHQHELVLQS